MLKMFDLHIDQRTPLATSTDSSRDKTNHDDYILTKTRFCIVLQDHHDHHIILPIYTFGGVGLRHHTPEAKREFISIRDPRIPDFENQRAPLPPLKPLPRKDARALHAKAVVWITRPYSLSYGCPWLQIMGELDEESTSRLRKFYLEQEAVAGARR
jgi:hypothetical protein